MGRRGDKGLTMQISALTLMTVGSSTRAADLSGEPAKTKEPQSAAQAWDEPSMALSSRRKLRQAFCRAATAVLLTGSAATAADLSQLAPAEPIPAGSTYNWTGFYAGMSTGDAWGKSKWHTNGDLGPDSGSFSLSNPVNIFNEEGSWFNGLQAGYNYQLPSRFVIGAEADARFSAYPDARSNLSIGGASNSNNTAGVYSQNIYASGSVRGRLGYTTGNWLFYGTGGLAWEAQQSYVFPQLAGSNLIAGAVGLL